MSSFPIGTQPRPLCNIKQPQGLLLGTEAPLRRLMGIRAYRLFLFLAVTKPLASLGSGGVIQ